MSAEMEIEVRRNLLRYVDGEWTLDELKEWFYPATWELDDVPLVIHVKVILTEREDASDEELRDVLRALATTYGSNPAEASLSGSCDISYTIEVGIEASDDRVPEPGALAIEAVPFSV